MTDNQETKAADVQTITFELEEGKDPVYKIDANANTVGRVIRMLFILVLNQLPVDKREGFYQYTVARLEGIYKEVTSGAAK